MKGPRLLWVLGGAAALLAIAITAIVALLKGPPIIIVGGSIRGTFSNGWNADKTIGRNRAYWAKVKTNTVIYLKNVYLDGSSSPAPSPLLATKGFLIEFQDADANYQGPAKVAVIVCSFAGCDPNKPLSTDNQTVYLRIRRQADRLEEIHTGSMVSELRFHNQDNQCDPQDSPNEGPCDKISKIGIHSDSSATLYDCGGHGTVTRGDCQIAIGTKPAGW